MSPSRLQSLYNKLAKIPLTFIFLIILIACMSFALLYSAAGGNISPWASKQIIYFLVFTPVMLVIAIIDIRFWYKSAYFLYYISLALLILVELLGHTAMGATRWINLGLFKLQPSELMKICIIFVLARYFHDLAEKKIRPIHLIRPILLILIPTILIIKQPDLATGLIILILGAMMFFLAGVNRWVFIAGFISTAIAIPVAWKFMYIYQQNRIMNFFDPDKDPLGSGYNIIQSKIAIGSGGFWGKGFIKGTQSQLQFLPERQTDFIFTLLCEEWGLLGGLLLLMLYVSLIFYSYVIALNSRSIFGRLMGLGIACMLFLHIFINIAMAMGIVPAAGIPLPLLSYGGTMMATVLISLGLIMSAHIHNRATINNALKSFF